MIVNAINTGNGGEIRRLYPKYMRKKTSKPEDYSEFLERGVRVGRINIVHILGMNGSMGHNQQ